MTKEQVKTFLATAETNRYYALYVLAVTTGMRFGGLFYSDLDLSKRKVLVRRALITWMIQKVN